MNTNRRNFIHHSSLGVFGFLAVSNNKTHHLPHLKGWGNASGNEFTDSIYAQYPSTDPEDIRKVVGAAHTNLDEVKKRVTARPELAKATYDWGFGDVESALGAASHMGRKDIAEFLIEYGARPNIFTFAMLGKIDAVKTMIEGIPGIQTIKGPHGFTLMHHAQIRLRRENVDGKEKADQEALVRFLESIEGADIRDAALEITAEEQNKYYGMYRFGDGEDEYFEVDKNSRGRLFMRRGEYTGRALNRTGDHVFSPGGAPSVKIVFELMDGMASSLTIYDPDPILKAARI